MKMKIIATHCILFVLLAQTTVVFAVEVAPRITDREIIERLTRLEEGQAALLREMNQRFDEMNRSIDQRFESVNQRFDGMNLSINQRFESMDKRLDMVVNLMYVIIAGIFGLIGFVVWDRRNATKPVRQDIDRLFQVMRKLAEKDQKIAEVLRSVGLL